MCCQRPGHAHMVWRQLACRAQHSTTAAGNSYAIIHLLKHTCLLLLVLAACMLGQTNWAGERQQQQQCRCSSAASCICNLKDVV
jgi:hypothetical protein